MIEDLSVTVIILTYNEEMHIKRCVNSVRGFARRVVVVDSFSSDRTVQYCQEMNVDVFQNKWVNHSTQFNWALSNCGINTEWVFWLDADEYCTVELVNEVHSKLSKIPPDCNGIVLKRKLIFFEKWIRFGGAYPIRLLRIWRNGSAQLEVKWKDAHAKLLSGYSVEFESDIVDCNLKGFSSWINKQNNYAIKEVVDELNAVYGFYQVNQIDLKSIIDLKRQDKFKRFIKKNFYYRLPLFFRAIIFFLYSYIFRAGFLDGTPGFLWAFMQILWYRMIVDAKMFDLKMHARSKNDVISYLKKEYGIHLCED